MFEELASLLDTLSAALYDIAVEISMDVPFADTFTAADTVFRIQRIFRREHNIKWSRYDDFLTVMDSGNYAEIVRASKLAKSLADVERYSVPVLVPPPGWTEPNTVVPDMDMDMEHADMVYEEMRICIHKWDTPVPMSNGGQVYDCEKCGYREVRREVPTVGTQTESDEDMDTVFIPETPPRAPTKKRRMAIVEDTPDRLGSRLRPIVLTRAYKKRKCSNCSNGTRGCHCVWFL